MILTSVGRSALALLALTLWAGSRASAAGPLKPDMILVPGGEFLMGSKRGADDERPRRSVTVSAFRLARTEVTNAQYLEFWLGDGEIDSAHTPISYDHIGPWPDIARDRPDDPVVGVTWHDAAAYARWAECRLPTEAEWERAARGDDARVYPWGDAFAASIDGVQAHANVRDADGGYVAVAPVGSYPAGASPFGILDMAGNVGEWVADAYAETHYRRATHADPSGPDAGFYRVYRGGSWAHDSLDSRVSRRLFESPTMGLSYVGLRVACDE